MPKKKYWFEYFIFHCLNIGQPCFVSSSSTTHFISPLLPFFSISFLLYFCYNSNDTRKEKKRLSQEVIEDRSCHSLLQTLTLPTQTWKSRKTSRDLHHTISTFFFFFNYYYTDQILSSHGRNHNKPETDDLLEQKPSHDYLILEDS